MFITVLAFPFSFLLFSRSFFLLNDHQSGHQSSTLSDPKRLGSVPFSASGGCRCTVYDNTARSRPRGVFLATTTNTIAASPLLPWCVCGHVYFGRCRSTSSSGSGRSTAIVLPRTASELATGALCLRMLPTRLLEVFSLSRVRVLLYTPVPCSVQSLWSLHS